MRFLNPSLLFILLLLIPMGALIWYSIRLRGKKIAQFVHPKHWPELVPGYSKQRLMIKGALLLTALFFIVLTVARPSWGQREQLVVDRGLDVMIALDVSNSMMAEDVSPNRLEHAKSRLRELLNAIPGNRVGLMPFAGDAFVISPMTSDYSFVQERLNTLQPGAINTPGTNFSRALDVAEFAFEQGSVGTKVLIFVTDGENHGSDLDAAIARAKEDEIRIYSIGIGDSNGAPMEIRGNKIIDPRTGEEAISKLDSATLKKMADETGGEAYIASAGSRVDISPLISDVQYLESIVGSESSAKRLIPEERFQFPLFIALLLIMIESLISSSFIPIRKAATT